MSLTIHQTSLGLFKQRSQTSKNSKRASSHVQVLFKSLFVSHLPHIPLADTGYFPDSRSVKIDFTFSWKELQSHIEGMETGSGRTCDYSAIQDSGYSWVSGVTRNLNVVRSVSVSCLAFFSFSFFSESMSQVTSICLFVCLFIFYYKFGQKFIPFIKRSPNCSLSLFWLYTSPLH